MKPVDRELVQDLLDELPAGIQSPSQPLWVLKRDTLVGSMKEPEEDFLRDLMELCKKHSVIIRWTKHCGIEAEGKHVQLAHVLAGDLGASARCAGDGRKMYKVRA